MFREALVNFYFHTTKTNSVMIATDTTMHCIFVPFLRVIFLKQLHTTNLQLLHKAQNS